MHPYEKLARESGFTEAVFLENIALQCKPELRAYCNPAQCPNHGQNWVCPPACGTLEACQKKALRFHQGLVLQSVTPSADPETYGVLAREHNLRLGKLVEALKADVAEVLPLSTGGCVFCEACSYPAPCIHPDVKMESLSAFGIDVGDLCRSAGLPYAFCRDRLYLTALVMVKKE